MNRGILLIALGHPNYGRYAVNLCASIKAADSTFPVAVVVDEKSLSHSFPEEKFLFDKIIQCPPEATDYNGKKAYVKAKLYADLLTPFKETIFMDVDIAWIPKRSPNELFEQLKDTDFQVKNNGWYDVEAKERHDPKLYTYNCDPQKMATHFKIQKFIPQCQGEFIYFKKNARTKKIFDKARKVFETSTLKTTYTFAGIDMNDEFALNAAIGMLNVEMKMPYNPIYWHYTEKQSTTRTEIHQQYFAISIGGNRIPPTITQHYNDIIGQSFNRLKLQHPFKLTEKRAFLPERAKV